MSTTRRGLAAALAATAVLSSLTACTSSGRNTVRSANAYTAVSNIEYQPVNGINLDSTYLRIRNLYLLTAEGDTPPRLSMTVVNQSRTLDAVVGAQVGALATSGELVGGTLGAVPVVPGTSVIVGADAGPDIVFPGLTVLPGRFVPVRLLFRSGRAVTGQILVQNAISEHSDGTIPFGTAKALPTSEATSNPLPPVPAITAEPGASESPTATASPTPAS